MKNLAKLLLLGLISVSDAAKAIDDFSDIKMTEILEQDRSERKTLTLEFQRSADYKDIVKDSLFEKHLNVKASDDTAVPSADAEATIVDDSIAEEMKVHNLGKEGRIEAKILDNNRMQYYTKMFIGSEQQEIKVAFDTMTPISLIDSFNCEGCNTDNEEGKGFYYQKSYSIRKISDQKVNFHIEGQVAKGVLVSDDIWLDKESDDSRIKEFPFLLVNQWEQNKFETTQGVLGLSKTFYKQSGESTGPAFLNFLYEKGVINERMFAVHFDHVGGSTVEFGGYDIKKIIPNVPLTYLELVYSKFWKLRVSAIRIGEKPKFSNGSPSAFYFPEKEAILDTFSPYIKLPHSMGSTLFSEIFHDTSDVQIENDLLMGPCDLTKYNSINLFINDRYFLKLTPESYVVDIGIRGRCFIPFQYNTEDEFVLGEPFFRNFYSVFDDSKGILGVAPSINSVRSSIIEGMVPNDELPYPHPQKKPT
jgi:hypothetical protein